MDRVSISKSLRFEVCWWSFVSRIEDAISEAQQ